MSERRDESRALYFELDMRSWLNRRTVSGAWRPVGAEHIAYAHRVTDRMERDSSLALAALLNMARERDMYEEA